ncbi:NAD(P)/FAD-dependent oxidoreductase [Paraburkholderia phenazinium]|jgi:NADPH-dependent 2,4-dienoyl-CoA reductase/sulfur reductase-like enzyme|uniref:Thioredoxin reductase n=1 Tax=Paraburkholderia phenazinium TaxID=60549 RepID=A0A1G7SB30_9BURK|nr:NAD(P)/FAD-dependent oxidoreductase [Paraburkholderia phenazinium]SDG20218.1 Thioredoxin reductase [Paraburkholderia phenazinium]
MTIETVDLVIVGAGPAGMACALDAARAGLDVLVLDENPMPGGQIYRNVGRSPLPDAALLGDDYTRGAGLVSRFAQSGIRYWPETLVWQITRSLEISFTRRSGTAASGQIQAKAVMIANGAYERPCPVPGWTLPGVMGVGAAQTLFKSSALLPEGPVVLAGSGPLMYLFAWQLIQAGRVPAAILDTTPSRNYWRALADLPGALRTPAYLLKGQRLLSAIRRSGIPHIRHVTQLSVEGEGRAEAVQYIAKGRTSRLAASVVLLHQGVVPNVQLTRSIGCDHRWDEAQLCWHPCTDAWGETTVPGLFIAGDGGGIQGAIAAQTAGALSALALSHRLGAVSREARDEQAAPLRRELERHRAVRPFLDTLYRPADVFRRPADETIVCRCEEVRAGEIRAMARLGCTGPNQTKSFSRCGMGPCQGRLCGLTVAELLAEAQAKPVAEVGYYRIRPPIKPVSLGDLAESHIPDINAAKPTEFAPK